MREFINAELNLLEQLYYKVEKVLPRGIESLNSLMEPHPSKRDCDALLSKH